MRPQLGMNKNEYIFVVIILYVYCISTGGIKSHQVLLAWKEHRYQQYFDRSFNPFKTMVADASI